MMSLSRNYELLLINELAARGPREISVLGGLCRRPGTIPESLPPRISLLTSFSKITNHYRGETHAINTYPNGCNTVKEFLMNRPHIFALNHISGKKIDSSYAYNPGECIISLVINPRQIYNNLTKVVYKFVETTQKYEVSNITGARRGKGVGFEALKDFIFTKGGIPSRAAFYLCVHQLGVHSYLTKILDFKEETHSYFTLNPLPELLKVMEVKFDPKVYASMAYEAVVSTEIFEDELKHFLLSGGRDGKTLEEIKKFIKCPRYGMCSNTLFLKKMGLAIVPYLLTIGSIDDEKYFLSNHSPSDFDSACSSPSNSDDDVQSKLMEILNCNSLAEMMLDGNTSASSTPAFRGLASPDITMCSAFDREPSFASLDSLGVDSSVSSLSSRTTSPFIESVKNSPLSDTSSILWRDAVTGNSTTNPSPLLFPANYAYNSKDSNLWRVSPATPLPTTTAPPLRPLEDKSSFMGLSPSLIHRFGTSSLMSTSSIFGPGLGSAPSQCPPTLLATINNMSEGKDRDTNAFALAGTEWFGTIIQPPSKEEENTMFGTLSSSAATPSTRGSTEKSGDGCFPSPIGPRPRTSMPVPLANMFFPGNILDVRRLAQDSYSSEEEGKKFPSELHLKDWMQQVMRRRADASLIQLFVRRLEDKARCLTVQDLVANKKNLSFEYLQQLGFQRDHCDCLMAALATYTSL